MSIYTDHSALKPQEIEELKESAENQDEAILAILKETQMPFAIFEMIELTGIHHSSVNRALSSMSSDSQRYYAMFSDDEGRMPVIKSKEETSFNPKTSKTCCTYRYNNEYGKSSLRQN